MAVRKRNLEQTRAQIMAVAFEQIFRNGYQGVSVNDIVQKTDVTKGAFFHHFPTKQALGYAVVDETVRELTIQRWIKPLEGYANPVQGILKQLKKSIDESSETRLALGCPLNNLIQEMSSVDPVFKKKLQSILLLWIGEIENYVKKAQRLGYVKKSVKPRQVAEFIVMAHEGFFGIIKGLGGDKKVYYSLYESLRAYVQSISV